MRTAAFSVWPRLLARLWIGMKFPRHVPMRRDCPEEELPDHLKRDLGLLDGRERVGPGRARQSDEMREALRLLPRPL